MVGQGGRTTVCLVLVQRKRTIPRARSIPGEREQLAGRKGGRIRAASHVLTQFLGSQPLHVFTDPFVHAHRATEVLSRRYFTRKLRLARRLLRNSFEQVRGRLVASKKPLTLIKRRPFLRSCLLRTTKTNVRPSLTSVSIISCSVT